MTTWTHILWSSYSAWPRDFKSQPEAPKNANVFKDGGTTTGYKPFPWYESQGSSPQVERTDCSYFLTPFFFLIFTFLHLNNLQTVLLKPECTNNSLGELVQTQTDFAGRLRPERLHCQDTGEADGPGPWTTLPAADFQGLWWKRSNTYWSGWMWGERTSLSRSCHLGFSLSRNALYTDS